MSPRPRATVFHADRVDLGAGRRGLGSFALDSGLCLLSSLSSAGRRAFAFVEHAEQRVDLDGVAFLDQDLAQRAGGRRRHFQRHLVGFQFHQRLAVVHGIAGFLEPLSDRGFGDGFTQGGNADFFCHCSVFPAGQIRRDWASSRAVIRRARRRGRR
jgi:hypothetical protein